MPNTEPKHKPLAQITKNLSIYFLDADSESPPHDGGPICLPKAWGVIDKELFSLCDRLLTLALTS